MRIDKVEYKVYKFDELSREAKDRAIKNWYDNEDYPFLEDDMTEELYHLLDEAGYKYRRDDLKVMYSLGYSQGDGACFTGHIWREDDPDFNVYITHVGRYYHERSVEFEFTDETGGMVSDDEAFEDQYRDICRKLARYGYDILEYRMNDEEFSELCEANEYEFHEDGRMY